MQKIIKLLLETIIAEIALSQIDQQIKGKSESKNQQIRLSAHDSPVYRKETRKRRKEEEESTRGEGRAIRPSSAGLDYVQVLAEGRAEYFKR